MAKTRRMIKSSLPTVDGVAEIIDARIPVSSRNPELKSLLGDKPRIVILNKCSLADERETDRWISRFKSEGAAAIAVDCKSGRGLSGFVPAANELLADIISRAAAKGMSGRPMRFMVVGIPNVGKSSFINRMAGSNKAAVEDRPGVTRDRQWVKAGDNTELLDMPGVLWPKFEDKLTGEHLAFTGAIKDDIVDTETLACRLLECLNEDYHDKLTERYSRLPEGSSDGYELLMGVGKSRGMLIKGGEIDTERAAKTVLDEFRSGKLGRMTLERVI